MYIACVSLIHTDFDSRWCLSVWAYVQEWVKKSESTIFNVCVCGLLFHFYNFAEPMTFLANFVTFNCCGISVCNCTFVKFITLVKESYILDPLLQDHVFFLPPSGLLISHLLHLLSFPILFYLTLHSVSELWKSIVTNTWSDPSLLASYFVSFDVPTPWGSYVIPSSKNLLKILLYGANIVDQGQDPNWPRS